MKIAVLLLFLIASLGFCVWYNRRPHAIPAAKEPDMHEEGLRVKLINYADPGTGVKWEDSLYNHLPADLDTTVTVYDANNKALHFRQYIKAVFNKEAFIFQDKGVWRLQRKSKGAADTLKTDDDAVARIARWSAFQSDTVTSWQIKLNAIAHTLGQADRVLVLKRRRRLFVQHKGKVMLTFHVELGKQPIGPKQFENDGKTPEGIYHLDFKQTRADAYHKSMLISYPNAENRKYAKQHGRKPGMALLIHGTKPNKVKAKDWTNGCIAMQNKDLDVLFEYVAEGTLIDIRP